MEQSSSVTVSLSIRIDIRVLASLAQFYYNSGRIPPSKGSVIAQAAKDLYGLLLSKGHLAGMTIEEAERFCKDVFKLQVVSRATQAVAEELSEADLQPIVMPPPVAMEVVMPPEDEAMPSVEEVLRRLNELT